MEGKTVLTMGAEGEWDYYCETTAPTLELFYEDIKPILSEHLRAFKFQGEEETLWIETYNRNKEKNDRK